jgi:hypothetical protein
MMLHAWRLSILGGAKSPPREVGLGQEPAAGEADERCWAVWEARDPLSSLVQ